MQAPILVDMDATRHRVLEQAFATLDCRRIVDSILLDVDDEIVRMHVDHMTVPWTVQSVLTDLFESIEVAFAEREDILEDDVDWDDADHADVIETLEEPSPIPSDPWCRGMMHKRRPIPLPSMQNSGAPLGNLSMSQQLGASVMAHVQGGGTAAPSKSGTSPNRGGAKNGGSSGSVKPVNPVLSNSSGLNDSFAAEFGGRPGSASSSAQGSRMSGQGGFRGPRLNVPRNRPQSRPSGRSSVTGDRLDSHRSNSDTASQAPANSSPNAKPERGGRRGKQLAAGAASAGGSAANGHSTPQGTKFTEEELHILKKQKETQNRMLQLRRIADKVDHQLSDIKAQSPFVVDGATHTVIPVQLVDPMTLPARQELKVMVEKELSGKAAARAAAAAAAAAAANQDISGVSTIRSATPGGGQRTRGQTPSVGTRGNAGLLASPLSQVPTKVDLTLYYTQEAQVQPMISVFPPAAGVATKDGENVKRTELKVPKSKMSRLEYSKLLAGGASASSDPAPTGGQGAAGSGADAPVSPPLTSPATRRQSVQGAKKFKEGASVDTNAATPPPPNLSLGGNVAQQPQAGRPNTAQSMLDQPSRVLTPQPTASRPQHIRHQSPTRDNPKRAESAARNAAARQRTADLQAAKNQNAERKQQLRSKMSTTAVQHAEDETARDFLNSLEMGDFEALTAGDDEYTASSMVDHNGGL